MMNRSDFRRQLQEGLNAVFGLEYPELLELQQRADDLANLRIVLDEQHQAAAECHGIVNVSAATSASG